MTRTYYRFSNKPTAMSDWGHAMFTENRDSVATGYGCNEYRYDGTGGVSIYELHDQIISAWEYDRKTGFTGDFSSWCTNDYYYQLTGEDAFEAFAPEHIVDSAAGYDTEMVVWLWERILEPLGIMAVITDDGAVVFDEGLIVRVEEERDEE